MALNLGSLVVKVCIRQGCAIFLRMQTTLQRTKLLAVLCKVLVPSGVGYCCIICNCCFV